MPQVMEMVSSWGPLIYAGCYAATLSSAIACIVGASRVFQALCSDKLYPVIHYFGVGYGPNNEPLRGYMFVCTVALACIMIGEMNFYVKFNFSCGLLLKQEIRYRFRITAMFHCSCTCLRS